MQVHQNLYYVYLKPPVNILNDAVMKEKRLLYKSSLSFLFVPDGYLFNNKFSFFVVGNNKVYTTLEGSSANAVNIASF